MAKVVDAASAEHYHWGEASEGWHLVNRPELSVICERVPPGDKEKRHFHSRARQFFYILDGEAAIDIGDSRVVLRAGQGIEIPPGVPHQFRNQSARNVAFLVVSVPHAHGDRVET